MRKRSRSALAPRTHQRPKPISTDALIASAARSAAEEVRDFEVKASAPFSGFVVAGLRVDHRRPNLVQQGVLRSQAPRPA